MGRSHRIGRRVIDGGLVVSWVLGVWLAWELPGLAGVALVFPLMMTCFFKGLGGVIMLGPLLIWHHLVGHPWQEDALVLLAACLGVLFAVVTVAKYRQARAHELSLGESLKVARQVQLALEPAQLIGFGPAQITCLKEVSQDLGGDLLCTHAISSCRLCVVIGDVMGKGVPAALVAAFVVGSFHELVEETGEMTRPRAILEQLNRLLLRTFSEQTLFVTLACLELDLGTSEWRCCLAGHPRPILLRQDGSLQPFGSQGLVAGLQESPPLEEVCLPALAGDQILLGTDGLLDEAISDDAIAAAFVRWAHAPLEQALAGVVAEVGRLRPQRGSADDLTAVLIRL